nr:hypothetical protein GCM10025732_05100 [Glycomyces mayteni]
MSPSAARLRCMADLTHVDPSGAARMVDVSGKDVSQRSALATGRLRTTPEVVAALRANSLAKGDALATARIAGIMAAKRTLTWCRCATRSGSAA